MIKINNKEYHDYEIKITWGNFENNIFIGLELLFSKKMIEDTKLNTLTNISEYIIDITYEDKNGWLSLINQKYSCNIKRTNESIFKLELCIESKEDEKLNIVVESNIEIL